MLLIGIVGSIAGGKSTVAKRLEELGATWLNADLVAREVLELPHIQAKLIEHFGDSITNKDGLIDRALLADQVFGDDEASKQRLTYLESVIHPQTRLELTKSLQIAEQKETQCVILDVPLLFESGWDLSCDVVWCVDAPREIRANRVQSRGWDRDELIKREANQMGIDEKAERSTTVIQNDGSLEELRETVNRLWGSLHAEADRWPPGQCG